MQTVKITHYTYPLLLLCLLLLCSCQPATSLTGKEALPLQLPERWTTLGGTDADNPGNWLDSFSDPALMQLINEGLQSNFSLQSAAARIGAARARANQAGAALLPVADLEFDAARRRTQSNGTGSINNSFGLNGTIRWEVDLWKRLTLAEQAAVSDAQASVADYRAAQLSLAASIARSWYRLNEAKLQLQLTEQTVTSYRQSLQVIEEQYRGGLTSALDLRLARLALSNAQATLAERSRLFDAEQRLLEQLLGRYPAGRIVGAEQLPHLPSLSSVGIPSTLLERRPDLRAADLRLQAAGQRSTAAQRNRLPVFQLTTAAGTASDRLYRLLDWDYLVWSLAGSLAQSLFDGGSKTAEQDLARAQLEQQLAEYAEAALTAFREVEVTLAAESTLFRQEQALQLSVEEADEAQLLAEQRYRQGLEGIITLLETQRRAFSAHSSVLHISRLRLENRIDLHLALGGSLIEPGQPNKMMESP